MVQQENSELRKLNIAIDGYSGCGKSTLARDLAARLNYTFVDTGALYRGVTWYFLKNALINLASEGVVMLDDHPPRLSFASGSNHLLLNEEDIESIIRNNSQVADKVSDVAAIARVREFLKSIQKSFFKQKGVVMEGRDIGTIIMPDADVKMFITASLEERVKRRFEQLVGQGTQTSESEVQTNLQDRDRKDANRETAPLKKAIDAIVIDTTEFDQYQQLAMVLALIRPHQSPERYLPFIH